MFLTGTHPGFSKGIGTRFSLCYVHVLQYVSYNGSSECKNVYSIYIVSGWNTFCCSSCNGMSCPLDTSVHEKGTSHLNRLCCREYTSRRLTHKSVPSVYSRCTQEKNASLSYFGNDEQLLFQPKESMNDEHKQPACDRHAHANTHVTVMQTRPHSSFSVGMTTHIRVHIHR